MRTRILGKMLNSEVQDYLQRNDIIIVPVCTTKMYGGFLLNCETVISESYALKMDETCDVLVPTVLPILYLDSIMQFGKNTNIVKNFIQDFQSITLGADKIMNPLDDVPLATGYDYLYSFGENSDHFFTPDIPDIETRDRMAETGTRIISTLVERMNMPHIVKQFHKKPL